MKLIKKIKVFRFNKKSYFDGLRKKYGGIT